MRRLIPALLTAIAAALVAAFALPPKPKGASAFTAAVACAEADCWVKATWKLHPSFSASTDSVRLVWTQGSATLATHYTKLTSDSIPVARGSVDKAGKVAATVYRKDVSQSSPAVEAPWTVPAAVTPPSPVDSLKTQVGVLVLPGSATLAANGKQQFCGYGVYSDGSRQLVSGTGCS